jgi:hypothetical protein
MSNPFEQNSNPWSSSNEPSGPVYGNAYEDTNKVTSPALPPRAQPASPYGTQRMPSPSDYQQPTANAWQESNKTLDEGSPSPQPQNAYQYTGTAYGNPASPTNAYSPQPTHTPTPMHVSDDNNNKKNETIETDSISKNSRPSRIRLLMRFILFVFAVGHLGFAAGASPVSFFFYKKKKVDKLKKMMDSCESEFLF